MKNRPTLKGQQPHLPRRASAAGEPPQFPRTSLLVHANRVLESVSARVAEAGSGVLAHDRPGSARRRMAHPVSTSPKTQDTKVLSTLSNSHRPWRQLILRIPKGILAAATPILSGWSPVFSEVRSRNLQDLHRERFNPKTNISSPAESSFLYRPIFADSMQDFDRSSVRFPRRRSEATAEPPRSRDRGRWFGGAVRARGLTRISDRRRSPSG